MINSIIRFSIKLLEGAANKLKTFLPVEEVEVEEVNEVTEIEYGSNPSVSIHKHLNKLFPVTSIVSGIERDDLMINAGQREVIDYLQRHTLRKQTIK